MNDKRDRKKPSALHVRGGVDDRHDGLDQGAPSGGNGGVRRSQPTAQDLIRGVLAGDRTLLARAITLIESGAGAHRDLAREVLDGVLPQSGHSLRVGITGVPGAGKSTFIEALGTLLTGRGHKVAVTAVDPSSSLTGGSILGDKTRMEKLAADPQAFIRPSPSGGTLGGVARKTRETIMLFEAAGYDVILVETVGVGQSEILVRSMVDFFLLMLIGGAGDDLQGIKKGVVEIADAIVVNKADGPGTHAAQTARAEFERVLHYLRPTTEGWQTRAFNTSATTGTGISEIWEVVTRYQEITLAAGLFEARRADQERQWMRDLVSEGLLDLFQSDPALEALRTDLEARVADGDLPATSAARRLLEAFRKRAHDAD